MVAKVVGHLYNNALNRPRIPQRGLCQVINMLPLSVVTQRNETVRDAHGEKKQGRTHPALLDLQLEGI